ncbi:MAG: DUF2786 domain-containing protein [Desulfosarcinaceae bacterium]|jgi:hypothetical protein
MKPSETLQIELERRILHGLRLEWQNACDDLPDEMATRMRPPLFRLSGAEGRLGGWNPDRGEIFLSRRLVLNHPWDAVCDVLRHEMAHQLVDALWPGSGERPHGIRFRQACRLLRAVPDASGTYPTLDQRVYEEGASPDDRILRRIRKLMALSDSPNIHEAEAAMVKAHALIAKYNLDLAACETNRHFVSVFLGRPALRHFREAYTLGQLLQHHYFIEAVWVPAYVVAKGKMGRVLEISGTRANVQIAAYVYDFVHIYIDGAWTRYRAGRKLSRHRKTDYAIGVIEGFSAKLDPPEASAADSHSDIRALVRRDDVALTRYLTARYPRLSRVQRGGRMDPEIHAAGKAEGRRMVISKGLSDSGGSATPALLTEKN